MIDTKHIDKILEGTFWRTCEECSICGDTKPCLENCESIDFKSTKAMMDELYESFKDE